jgi:hypothetical protein
MKQEHPIDTVSFGSGQYLAVYTTGGHRLAGYEACPPGWEGKILRLAEDQSNPEGGRCINVDVSAIVAIEFIPEHEWPLTATS